MRFLLPLALLGVPLLAANPDPGAKDPATRLRDLLPDPLIDARGEKATSLVDPDKVLLLYHWASW